MNLESNLVKLESSQLVRRLDDEDLSYLFKHTLTQETAYHSLLVKKRREIHLRVAQCYESFYAERLDEFAGLLAQHFAEAGDDAKTLKYATRAGDAAARVYANTEAIAQYSLALTAAERVNQLAPKNFRARGRVYETLGEFEAARGDYENALEVARALHDGAAEWQSLIDLGFLWAGREYARSGEYFQRALTFAESLREPKLRAHSLNRVGNWLANTGHARQGLQAHQEALEIFQAQRDTPGMAETYDLLGMANMFHGDEISAAEHLSRAIGLFRESGNREGLVSSLISHGQAISPAFGETELTLLGTMDETLRDLNEALRTSQQIGWLSGQTFAQFAFGWALLHFGRISDALAHAHQALRIATETSHQQWLAASYFTLGKIYTAMFDADSAIPLLEKGMGLARAVGSAWWIGSIASILAEAHIFKNDWTRAESILKAEMAREHRPRNVQERRMALAWAHLALAQAEPEIALRLIDQLIDSAPGSTKGQPIPHLWRWKGEALLALKRAREAEPLLEEAKRMAQNLGELPLLWEIHRALGNLHLQLKRPEQAQDAFAAARQVIASIEATVDDPALRETFLRAALATLPREKATRAAARASKNPLKKKSSSKRAKIKPARK